MTCARFRKGENDDVDDFINNNESTIEVHVTLLCYILKYACCNLSENESETMLRNNVEGREAHFCDLYEVQDAKRDTNFCPFK